MRNEIPEETQPTSGIGCLLRLTWMLVGNAVLAILLVQITLVDSSLLSLLSIAFWLVVGLIVLARYVDVTRFKGVTADGSTPATVRDVRQWSAGLVGLAGAAWVLAHAL